MKKLLLALIILIISILITSKPISAHPIDNSDSYIYFINEIDGSELLKNEGIVYTYINWFQAGLLVESIAGTTVNDITQLHGYQDLYETYVFEKLNISNGGQICSKDLLSSPITDEQISLSLGTRIIMQITCDTPINQVKIENTMMTEYFELPSNFVQIYTGEKLLYKTTLGQNNTVLEFNLDELIADPQGDLSIDYSKDYTQEEILKEQNVTNGEDVKSQSSLNQIADDLFIKIENLKEQSIFVILALVFLLGLLHTLEAGHSKAILASVMINNKMSYKNGVVYAGIFTITHLADIVILGIVFYFANSFFNIYARFALLENIAEFILLFVSIYILVKSIRSYLKTKEDNNPEEVSHALLDSIESEEGNTDHHHHHTHTHKINSDGNLKEQIWMAILAGLAPCIFGWSIFMVVLSSKQIWTIFPVVLSFGFGIFVALLIVVFIITKLRKPAFKRFNKFALLSPILSGVLLVSYALFLIFR